MGLVQAARRYAPDAHGGAPFAAYARRRIRGAILDSLRNGAWREANRPALRRTDPSTQTVSEAEVDRGTLALRVAAAIKALPDRQRSVLLMHYEDGLKFRAMAKVLQVNHQRASAIHMQAIRSLRRRLGS